MAPEAQMGWQAEKGAPLAGRAQEPPSCPPRAGMTAPHSLLCPFEVVVLSSHSGPLTGLKRNKSICPGESPGGHRRVLQMGDRGGLLNLTTPSLAPGNLCFSPRYGEESKLNATRLF